MLAIAPTIAPQMILWRPCLSDPPLCTIAELKTLLTIDDLADLHEALDLKEAVTAKAERSTQRKTR